jgi:hypothetical protein
MHRANTYPHINSRPCIHYDLAATEFPQSPRLAIILNRLDVHLINISSYTYTKRFNLFQ